MSMKSFYRYMLCLAVLASMAVSCTEEEENLVGASSVSDKVSISYSVADFQGVNVGTRAVADDEKKVNDITMAIFASDGTVVGNIVNLEVTDVVPVFIIDTKHKDNNGDKKPYILAGSEKIDIINDQSTLKACTIYMLANCGGRLNDIHSEQDLLQTDLAVEQNITIPENGFPMMGKAKGTIDLSADRADSATKMEDITLYKLYSKINVKFQINVDEVISIPKFQITGWKVNNIPTKVRLGEPEVNGETTPHYEDNEVKVFNTSLSTQLNEGSKATIHHSVSLENPESFEFSFYMPEHRVNSDVDYSYPTGITEVEKQRFKPILCPEEKNPVYVTVEGVYTDHQDINYKVTYNLYLGQNSVDDFHVKRNQLLKNVVTIKGITNRKPDDGVYNISTDFRVEVEEIGNYVVKVERDAALDSHFEVRPMDIFISGDGRVKVTVLDKTSTDTDPDRIWLRMEQGGKTGNDYTGSTGVRKYFTTNLVTSTLATGSTLEVSGEKSRIWLYIDENPNVFDKTILPADPNYNTYKNRYREISIQLEYYNAAGVKDESQTRIITFRQMNLWRLWSYTDDTKTTKSRYYDIEYYEEYLHNYAADQGFGKTTDGMEWGLDGLQLSDTDNAFVAQSKLSLDFVTEFLNNVNKDSNGKPIYVYDFYIDATESNCIDYTDIDKDGNNTEKIYHPYNGQSFTSKIISKAINAGTSYIKEKRMLNESPQSAVEYCYHKNKRKDDGTINTLDWYLPAIDEIEEIVVSGYSDFTVFQDKLYWSSQPAFTSYLWKANMWVIISTINYEGTLYVDNKNYARATKVKTEINDEGKLIFVSEDSYMNNPNQTLNFGSVYDPNKNPNPTSDSNITPTYDKGYMPRVKSNTQDEDGNIPGLHRIRCVRNTGTYAGN